MIFILGYDISMYYSMLDGGGAIKIRYSKLPGELGELPHTYKRWNTQEIATSSPIS